MNQIIYSNNVTVFLLVETIILALLSVSFFYALKILQHAKENQTSALAYALHKRSYLVTTVVSVVFFMKIFLFSFFIYTLNNLSELIPGAMCGAGVVDSNIYGDYSLAVKLSLIMFFSLWILLHKKDEQTIGYPYFRLKLWLFLLLYLLVFVEFSLESLFFLNIDTHNVVNCCSSIYIINENVNPLPLPLNISWHVGIFFSLYFVILLSSYFKRRVFLFLSSTFFIYIAYYVLVYFFGLYIYELPTHKCPFCIFQSEYYYIGYFLLVSLFLASYESYKNVIFYRDVNNFKKLCFFYTLFVFLMIYNFVNFYLTNGLFL